MWNDTNFRVEVVANLGLGHGLRYWVRSSPLLAGGTSDWSVGRALSLAKLDSVKGTQK
jgi:hypothetical protein